MRRLSAFILISILFIANTGHATSPIFEEGQLKNEIRKTLANNPELIFEALKGHEERLYDLLQVGLEKKNKSKIKAGRLKQLKNPKIAALHPNRPIWGNAQGDISIIVFSDFQSATCSKADKTILQLFKEHPEINYRFRHNPLGIHKMSRTAARYYEAMALQSHEKAIKLNHLILRNRLKIKKSGAKELDRLAQKTGANMSRLHKDINSAKVKAIVENDIREAKKLGFTASPVYLVNGVTVSGAATPDEFEEVFKMIRTQQNK